MVVSMPSTTNSRQAALQPHQAFVAVAAVDDQLADQAVVVGRDAIALVDAAVDAHAEAARRVVVGDGAGRGREGARVLGVDAALDGVARERDVAPASSDSGAPAAMRICSMTRSMPVITSVTGCSTCRRVFISMKKNSPSS